MVDVQMDERTLREIYLPHFRRAVQDARVGSVMSAYNRLNGPYCDLSSHLLTDILRDEWGRIADRQAEEEEQCHRRVLARRAELAARRAAYFRHAA